VATDESNVVKGLKEFGDSFLRYYRRVPKNPKAYERFVVKNCSENCDVRSCSTIFWVINVQRYLELPSLLQFLTLEEASSGTYLYRWGGAPLSYLMLVIAARPEELVNKPRSWHYEHPGF
jgi:hypothetical protein